MDQRNQKLRFGPFELHLATEELRKDGRLVKLQSQQLQLLALLAGRPSEMVSREEIRRALWSDGTNVDFDGSINFCVSQIREVLGDDPQNPRYIETLPRKGYRFVASVTEEANRHEVAARHPALPAETVRPRRWWPVFAGVGLAVVLAVGARLFRQDVATPIRSLAVLPLENLSHDPEQDYFAEGMTDALITDLARISALRVVSRTSVMQYKGTKKPVSQLARELNVDAVLEGTVARDQDQVRITAQLIRAEPERHLWAEKYEARMSGILAMQDEVAEAVVSAIQVKVIGRERSPLATRRAVDPAAYEAYLRGRYLWEQTGEENLKKSREYLEQAVNADPGYALAWAGLGDTYDYLASWGVLSSQDVRPRAQAAAQKALDLDGTLPGPLVTLAEVKVNYEWDWAGAERLCKQAIAMAPDYGQAHHVYATLLAEVGRVGEAVAEARRAHEVEPLSPVFSANVVWKLYLARQYRDAELESQKMSSWYRGFTGGYVLASVYLQTGRPREAVAELRKTATEWGRGSLELMYLGHGLGVSGAKAEGQQVLNEMLELSHQRYIPPDYIAMVYEGLGKRDQALRWYEKAFAERSLNGWILPDPQLDAIRAEPRFKMLLRNMGLPDGQ